MRTVTHKNRTYKIIESMLMSNFPNLQKENINIESTFVAEGARGSLISGYMYKNGSYIVF
jgi:hypothetical protein